MQLWRLYGLYRFCWFQYQQVLQTTIYRFCGFCWLQILRNFRLYRFQKSTDYGFTSFTDSTRHKFHVFSKVDRLAAVSARRGLGTAVLQVFYTCSVSWTLWFFCQEFLGVDFTFWLNYGPIVQELFMLFFCGFHWNCSPGSGALRSEWCQIMMLILLF